MNKKILYAILIIWLILIFIFSSINANDSNKNSEGIIKSVVTTTVKVLHIDANEKKIDEVVKNLNYPVRKCAHVFEYFVLGILLMGCIYNKNNTKLLYLIILVLFIYASIDEYHQLYTGRTGMFRDVILDTLGGSLGVISYFKFKLKYK